MISLIFHDEIRHKKNWFRAVSIPLWEVSEDLHFVLSTGQHVTVPHKFLTDLSSVPRFLWSFFPPFGEFLKAAILHDYLYKTRIVSRKQADYEMLYLSNQLNKNKKDNYIRYYAVRFFGSKAYRTDNYY